MYNMIIICESKTKKIVIVTRKTIHVTTASATVYMHSLRVRDTAIDCFTSIALHVTIKYDYSTTLTGSKLNLDSVVDYYT